ncbi:MAG: hypothetical protein PHR21_05260, partial [Oscillospiraceae bacterium]|nr:hypothetical protein [Oscillospiraceae bacterium]
RFPTLIVAATLLVLAVLTFTVGVILDVIVKKDRQQFELYLNLWQACSGADQRPAAESEPARD